MNKKRFIFFEIFFLSLATISYLLSRFDGAVILAGIWCDNHMKSAGNPSLEYCLKKISDNGNNFIVLFLMLAALTFLYYLIKQRRQRQ